MPKKLNTIGVVMPSDFPSEPYEIVHRKVNEYLARAHRGSEPPEWWREWAAAWNGLALRFQSCDRHHALYRKLLSSEGSLSHNEIAAQNKRLFDFYMNGLSAVENACYGLFTIGWVLKQRHFAGFDTDRTRRDINPKKTTRCFNDAFPNTALATELNKLVQSDQYKDWIDIRRILFHRASPGQIIFAGGPEDGRREWRLTETSTGRQIQLDRDTTVLWRSWLAETISQLVEAAATFARNEL